MIEQQMSDNPLPKSRIEEEQDAFQHQDQTKRDAQFLPYDSRRRKKAGFSPASS